MKPKLRQNQKFRQKLALTPQMRQSIKLLGMSTKDLNSLVDSAVEENPFLKKEFEENRKPSDSSAKLYRSTQVYDLGAADLRHEENPRASLVLQLTFMGLGIKVLEVAEHLIYEMGENGYIEFDINETCDLLSANNVEVKKALDAIQSLDPAGIGARNLKDCLQIQLRRSGKVGSLEYAIVTSYMNEMAQNDLQKIAYLLDSDIKKVTAAIKNIKKLNPRPAVNILSEKTTNVVPDLIANVSTERIELRINRSWLPSLAFYNPYESEPEIASDPEAKKFIKDNATSAKRLIDDLTKREETIFNVCDYILTKQNAYFIDTQPAIGTLTIGDIAKTLNMHVSTISRAISNKYIQINDKVYAINSLLSRGVKKADGIVTSKAAIKNEISKLVKNEDSAKPLNDDAIRKGLEEKGISLKRRTIAKYRNALRILPAYLRKKKQ
ncbi:RNA polymerase factor sigma-54 [Candidatus Omnitrophota bacterium]